MTAIAPRAFVCDEKARSAATKVAMLARSIIIQFLVVFYKWSNLWSSIKITHFWEKIECRKSQCLQGLSAFFVFSVSIVGVLLSKQARSLLQRRLCLRDKHSPIVKLLPLLISRLFLRRRRSKTSPSALHPDCYVFYRVFF